MTARDDSGKRRAIDLTPMRMSSFLSWADQHRCSPTGRQTHLMRVDRVVHDTPRHPARIHWQRHGPVHAPRDRRPAEQRAPVERQPEHDLRKVRDALHERVDDDEGEAGRAQEDRVPVELREDSEAHGELAAQED